MIRRSGILSGLEIRGGSLLFSPPIFGMEGDFSETRHDALKSIQEPSIIAETEEGMIKAVHTYG
jgi:hypothetical protein